MKNIKTLIGFKKYLSIKYGENYKGSQLTDKEIDTLQELKSIEKRNFYDYR